MKYFLYGLLILVVIIVLLLLIAIVRALLIKKEYQPAFKINGDVERSDEFATKLGKLVNCNTVTYLNSEDDQRFIHYHQIVKEMFPLIHEKLEKITIEEIGRAHV